MHDYTYDVLNRLAQATNPLPTNPLETFNYDPVGNRTNSNQNGASTFNQANQLLEDANNTYQYDNNGNLTRKTPKDGSFISTYEYDAENKLVRYVNDGTTANYRYDGLGRRVEKEVINGGTTVTRYVYDNEDILLELNGSNAIVARYTHGPGIDEPLIMEKTSQSFYYHADGLGSVTEITNQSGAVTQRYTYSSFGKIESQFDSNFVQPYTFTSREFDPETGLYYYRARYLDASIGTFLSEDPAGTLSDLNFYSYVRNNPVKFTDPSGQYVSQILMRGVNTILRNAAVSEEIAIQAKVLDAVVGVGATAAGVEIPQSVRNTEIPGLGGATIGQAVDGITLYGGIQTLQLGRAIASTSAGLGTAIGTAIATTPVAVGVSVALAGAAGIEVGTAINNLLLENRSLFPCGNPITRFITNPLFDRFNPQR